MEQTVRDTEDEWRNVLQTAEKTLHKAERQAVLHRDFEAFKTHNDGIQSWMREHNHSLQALGGHTDTEERLQKTQVYLATPLTIELPTY